MRGGMPLGIVAGQPPHPCGVSPSPHSSVRSLLSSLDLKVRPFPLDTRPLDSTTPSLSPPPTPFANRRARYSPGDPARSAEAGSGDVRPPPP